MSKIYQPYDKLFKENLKHIDLAKEFFFTYLPEEIRSQIDFNHFVLLDKSFIKSSFRSLETDILIETKFRDQMGYLYALAEQQSEPDDLLPFRTIQYCLEAMDDHLKRKKTTILPIVYPLIYFTGHHPEKQICDLFDLFGPHKELAKHILFNPIHLIPVKQVPDHITLSRKFIGLMELAFKLARRDNINESLDLLMPIIKQMEELGFKELIIRTVDFLIDRTEIDTELFLRKVLLVVEENIGDEIMTGREQLINMGIEKGIEIGRKEIATTREQLINMGIEKGIEIGRKEIAATREQLINMGIELGKNEMMKKISEILKLPVEKMESLLKEDA